jgi:hypothetical protein
MRKLILTLLVTLGSICPVNAGVLTYTITPTGGQSLYQFTLTNTGDTGGTLFDLFLSLPTDITNIDTTTIGTPVGWGDPTGGLLFFGPDASPSTSFIQWSADFSGLYDVGIGNSLGGFSFLASERIGQPVTFALNGTTDFATAQEVSSVPEPATFLLLLPVIAGLVSVCVRSRLVQTP